MDILRMFLSPVIVGILMFLLNRNWKRRDEKEESIKKERHEQELKHLHQHNMQTEGMLLLIKGNKSALESLKKLKDDKGNALLNGEVTAINKEISDYNKKFETFIIEK